MDKLFPTRDLITRLSARTSCASLALALIATAGTVEPGYASSVELKPYTASYKTRRFGMDIKMQRTLSREGEGYVLEEQAKALMQKIRQRSQFSVEDGTLVPEHFSYKLSGVVKRRREVQFPGDDQPVKSLYKGEWYEFPRQDNMYDRLSQQARLRLALLSGQQPEQGFELTVVDGKKAKVHQLDYLGQETLSTPIGEVETLHFIRRKGEDSTEFWLAPCWDYLIVRTRHTEDGEIVEALINDGSLDGAPLDTLLAERETSAPTP